MSNNKSPTPRWATIRRIQRVWDIYDALPLPIRAALQEGPARGMPVSSTPDIAAGNASSVKPRRSLSPSRSSELACPGNRRAQPWQPPGHGRRAALPSPHILARATMQTSGRGGAP